MSETLTQALHGVPENHGVLLRGKLVSWLGNDSRLRGHVAQIVFVPSGSVLHLEQDLGGDHHRSAGMGSLLLIRYCEFGSLKGKVEEREGQRRGRSKKGKVEEGEGIRPCQASASQASTSQAGASLASLASQASQASQASLASSVVRQASHGASQVAGAFPSWRLGACQ